MQPEEEDNTIAFRTKIQPMTKAC